jgi:hypothetical protein
MGSAAAALIGNGVDLAGALAERLQSELRAAGHPPGMTIYLRPGGF